MCIRDSYNAQFGYWSQQGAQMKVEDLMDFDPYLGRVVEPSQKSDSTPQSWQIMVGIYTK